MNKTVVALISLIGLTICIQTYAEQQPSKDDAHNEQLGGDDKQKKITIVAEYLEGGKDDEGFAFTSLKGDVVINLHDITIYADLATYYDDTRNVIAEGNIKIVHKDGTVVIADRIIYNDESKIAELEGSISIESDKATFTTNYLSYNTKTQKGYFKYGGTLVEGDNSLTSENGYYDRKNELAFFEDNVQLSNNDYSMYTEALKYSNITKVAKFKGYTTISSTDGKKSFSTYKGGEYNTKKKLANFSNGILDTDKFTIVADVINADQENECYKITGNVSITAKEDNVTLTGEYGIYNNKDGTAELFGNTLMTKQLDDDPLYLSADRFVAMQKKSNIQEPDIVNVDDKKIEVYAYDNVKIYKSDIQAKADTMVYKEEESIIEIHGNPVFWNYSNQITSDFAYITIKDKKLDSIHMSPNAFLTFRDNMDNYNQVSGERLKLIFTENTMTSMVIEGNVEVVYYAIDKKELKGLNVLKCGEIYIDLHGDSIDKIDFPIKAKGIFYPPHLIKDEYKWLKNFTWREIERPTRDDVVYSGFGSNTDFKEFKFFE